MIANRPGENYRSRPPSTLHHDIRRFYDECTADIGHFWYDNRNLALHYGYWDEHTRTHSQSLLDMNRALADAGRLPRHANVLDAGCGLGGSSIWIAEHYAATVTGITLSDYQVEAGRRHVRERGLAHLVNLEIADYCATPFADETFDAVWALESACHALSKRSFFAEAHRVLRRGGRLMMADGYATQREYSEGQWPTCQACLDGWHVPNLATKEELLGYLSEFGFLHPTFTDITHHVLPSATRMYRRALLMYPIEKLLEWMNWRTETQINNFSTALKQYEVFRGSWAGYGIFVGQKA